MHSAEDYRIAFDAMPPLTRLIFVLHRFDDLSYGEIGERLSIDIDTVTDCIAEALTTMLAALNGEVPSRLNQPEAAARIAAAEARIPPSVIRKAWQQRNKSAVHVTSLMPRPTDSPSFRRSVW